MLPSQRRAIQAASGSVQARWAISNALISASSPPDGGFEVVHGRRLHFELTAPHLALRVGSSARIYVQTDAGRERVSQDASVFDISAPGTLALGAGLVRVDRGHHTDPWRMTPQIPIYTESGPARLKDPARTRFACSVPLVAGMLPSHGVRSAEEIERLRKAHRYQPPRGLVVRPGERVHVGFRFTDESGAEQWVTASTKVITHPVLDVMEEDDRISRTTAYVGETLNLRVVDLGGDVSDRADTVSVLMQARSGAKHRVALRESDPHSGVFKAGLALTYAQGPVVSANYSVKRDGFPVVYGDEMAARYTDSNGVKTDIHRLTISKGANGSIEPFSKTYGDEEIAMRTQFSLAEAYLELAKRHRKLGEDKQAVLEYSSAKQLLAKAMEMFRDPETRAHAEYLLGNLTVEEADVTTDAELKETRYRAALTRFMNVTGSYPDTMHASKAQFKIATVYEKLNEPDIAAQEYVKLAYKHPESEHLALSMARLGTHFQRKAVGYEKRAEPLLAKTDDKDAQFDGKAVKAMSVREYLKSATIFSRLQERFPEHELAGKGGLRAGQAYMRAGKGADALDTFTRVVNTESYDGKTIRSQAMYWGGMCYEQLGQPMAAYSMYKRLTYDFPESKWASYARGRLSQDGMIRLETDLEIKRLEEGR